MQFNLPTLPTDAAPAAIATPGQTNTVGFISTAADPATAGNFGAVLAGLAAAPAATLAPGVVPTATSSIVGDAASDSPTSSVAPQSAAPVPGAPVVATAGSALPPPVTIAPLIQSVRTFLNGTTAVAPQAGASRVADKTVAKKSADEPDTASAPGPAVTPIPSADALAMQGWVALPVVPAPSPVAIDGSAAAAANTVGTSTVLDATSSTPGGATISTTLAASQGSRAPAGAFPAAGFTAARVAVYAQNRPQPAGLSANPAAVVASPSAAKPPAGATRGAAADVAVIAGKDIAPEVGSASPTMSSAADAALVLPAMARPRAGLGSNVNSPTDTAPASPRDGAALAGGGASISLSPVAPSQAADAPGVSAPENVDPPGTAPAAMANNVAAVASAAPDPGTAKADVSTAAPAATATTAAPAATTAPVALPAVSGNGIPVAAATTAATTAASATTAATATTASLAIDAAQATENFAAKIEAAGGRSRTTRSDSFKSTVHADAQQLAKGSDPIGTTGAKAEVAMPASPSFVRDSSPVAQAAAIAPDTKTDTTLPPAVVLTSTAHRAVEAVLDVTERFAARDQHSVNLQFTIGGSDLDVRVEMRGSEVHTTFRTDSPELRAALSNEWQSVTRQPGEDRSVRLAAPVFSSGNGSPSATADDGSRRQGAPRDERREGSAPAMTRQFTSAGTSSSAPSTPVSTPASHPSARSHRLQTLA